MTDTAIASASDDGKPGLMDEKGVLRGQLPKKVPKITTYDRLPRIPSGKRLDELFEYDFDEEQWFPMNNYTPQKPQHG